MFERKTNMHRLYLAEENNSWSDNLRKMVPVFTISNFELLFNSKQSLYKPGEESAPQKIDFFSNPASENTVYRNLEEKNQVSQKQIFETQFLIRDSLHRFRWKILPETRTVAGYECRKAVTTICDSVVVVAFYTDEIIPSTGPESFNGLPGMILEVAIPRLYTTWVATRVEALPAREEARLTAPKKGKGSTTQEVTKAIQQGIKSWGEKYYHRAVWFSTL